MINLTPSVWSKLTAASRKLSAYETGGRQEGIYLFKDLKGLLEM